MEEKSQPNAMPNAISIRFLGFPNAKTQENSLFPPVTARGGGGGGDSRGHSHSGFGQNRGAVVSQKIFYFLHIATFLYLSAGTDRKICDEVLSDGLCFMFMVIPLCQVLFSFTFLSRRSILPSLSNPRPPSSPPLVRFVRPAQPFGTLVRTHLLLWM